MNYGGIVYNLQSMKLYRISEMLLKLMFAWVDVFLIEIRQWIQILKSTVYISVHFKKELTQDTNFGVQLMQGMNKNKGRIGFYNENWK